MSLFRRRPEPDSIRLGRLHEAPTEVHYDSGSDHWWYHGFLRLTETRPIREEQFSRELRDPRNVPITQDLEAAPNSSNDEVARKHGTTAEIVREIRESLARRNEPHTLRLYGLDSAGREEQKLLGTIDQDLIAEAPTIPYSETEKGATRRQWAVLGLAAGLYAALLVATFASLSAASTAGANVQAIGAEVESWMVVLAFCVAVPGAAVGTYLTMARRTRVLDIHIQPLRESLAETTCEIVCLVESQKTPAPSYLTHLFRLRSEAVEQLAESFKSFQAGLIDDLQTEVRSLRRELAEAHSQRFEGEVRAADRAALGYGERAGLGGWSPGSVVLAVAIAAAVVGFGVWAAMGG